MGADGGVVYIPLCHGTLENYKRVVDLLNPFWQFLSANGCAYWAEEGHHKWEEENHLINPPNYIMGYYGTDRGDYLSLDDLANICEPFQDWHGDLFELTFDELDLDCRTAPLAPTGRYFDPPLYRLWFQHFKYSSREAVIKELGPLVSMKIRDWTNELNELLCLDQTVTEETWT